MADIPFEHEPGYDPLIEEARAFSEEQHRLKQIEEQRLPLRWIGEVLANPTRPKWLLRDILEENVMALMAGPRGTYKSFIALHWAMLVACAGFEVLIVSAEGSGIDRRIRAWLMRHAPERDPKELKVVILERRVNFNDDEQTLILIEEIDRMGVKPALTVIDTLSKNSGGLDENSNSEVKAFIGRIDNGIRRRFQGSVLLVHHTGHVEGGRARGASALEADTDAAYIIKREPGTRVVSVSRERFKDSGDLDPLNYQAEVTDLGEKDEFDQPVTSLVLVPATAEVASDRQSKNGPRGSGQKQLLRALGELQKASDAPIVWTQADIRKIGRSAGLTKDTAWSASAALCQYYLVACVGGYRLRKTGEKD